MNQRNLKKGVMLMTTPLANTDSLRIGSIDFVSPSELRVLLDIEAPNSIALNTGSPKPFPRINSYVLIPGENGFIVSQIEWITVERSQYPKRKGIQDFGIIDLPYPLRKMSINPLGVLTESITYKDHQPVYCFHRGIEIFPTVGDPVFLPTETQLKSIVESGEARRVKIGTSPLAGNASVSIDPDRLFGRHLAILGNTGSGKSCSVAGVIRWSIEAASKPLENEKTGNSSNSRFIILDPNGEYSTAFSGLQHVKKFGVEANLENHIKQLKVPLWLFNSSEWAAISQASAKTQRPTITQALRSVRDGEIQQPSGLESHDMRRYLRTLVSSLTISISKGHPWGTFPWPKNFTQMVEAWRDHIVTNSYFNAEENAAIFNLQKKLDSLLSTRKPTSNNLYPNYNYTRSEVNELLSLTRTAHETFGGSSQDILPIDADIPRPFTGEEFIHSIEANAELLGTSEYIETMLMRIRSLLSDSILKRIICSDTTTTLEQWLDEYICPSNTTEGSITVIDLSLIPAELIHIITAVIARMTLEALQRYRKLNNGKTLPTTLVMEEAHLFVKRYNNESEDSNAFELCTRVFEKIAREGRKFGLGLVLSSQRPSELSPTVLSQCNSFLLHRISNDRDQELVSRLVPDNLRGLLRELPSLPSQNAILLGWASELPVLVHMNYLKKEFRPRSDDPKYWNVWTNENRTVDWGPIAEDWQEYGKESNDTND
jgi:hypothetical protein